MFKNRRPWKLAFFLLLGNLFFSVGAFAQTSWLHDLTLYSDASKEKMVQVLEEFNAKQARTKKLGEEYLGAEYYHFEIDAQREVEFLQRLRAIGEYSYDLRESFLANNDKKARFVIWHVRESFPVQPNVFRIAKKVQRPDRKFNSRLLHDLDRFTAAGPVVFEENPDWDEKSLHIERLKKQEDNVRLSKCKCDLVVTWAPNPVVNGKIANVASRNFMMQKSELKNFIASLVKGGTTKVWKSSIAGKSEIRVQFINTIELKSKGFTIAKYLKSKNGSVVPNQMAKTPPTRTETPEKSSRQYSNAEKSSSQSLGPKNRKVASETNRSTENSEEVSVKVVKGSKSKNQISPSAANIDMSQYVLKSDYEALLAEVHKLTLEIQAMKEVVSRIRPTSLSRVPSKPGSRMQGGVLPSIGPVTTKSNTTTTTTTVVTTTTQSTVTTEVGSGNNKETTVSTNAATQQQSSAPVQTQEQANQLSQKKPDEEDEQKKLEEEQNQQSRMPAQAPTSPVPEVKVTPSLPATAEPPVEEGIEGTTIEYLD